MNKQQRKFHKEIKHRQKRAAKIRGGIQGEYRREEPVDNQTVEEKIGLSK